MIKLPARISSSDRWIISFNQHFLFHHGGTNVRRSDEKGLIQKCINYSDFFVDTGSRISQYFCQFFHILDLRKAFVFMPLYGQTSSLFLEKYRILSFVFALFTLWSFSLYVYNNENVRLCNVLL